jgi:hypothetical protein
MLIKTSKTSSTARCLQFGSNITACQGTWQNMRLNLRLFCATPKAPFHIDCGGTTSGRRTNIIRRGQSDRRFLVHAKMLASTISQPSASHSHRPSYPQSVSRGGSTPPPVPPLSFLSETSKSMIPPPRKKKDCSCTKPPSPIKKTPRPGTPTSPLFHPHV